MDAAPTVDYLRISLIDRCNFRCQYCMPPGIAPSYAPHPELLTDSEIVTLVSEVFGPLGFGKFRLTGGEPLLRVGLPALVAQLSALPCVEDLALTTNAYRLRELARPLYEAGLRRINISLDSLQPATFQKIIGTRHSWHQVWEGILAAHRVGFDPLKLNIAVVPGINDGEILDLAALTRDRHWHVRFIEFMPIGNPALFGNRAWIPSEELREQIRARWGLETASVRGNGPADIFKIPGALGTLGFISQMSECFCDRCNRVRLSADGWLRPCLLNETGQIDLKSALRNGDAPARLRERVRQLLQIKAEINFKERQNGTATGTYSRTMSQIGG